MSTKSEIDELFQRIEKFRLKNDLNSAVFLLHQILKKDPNNAKAMRNIALLYYAMPKKSLSKAKGFAEKAYQLDPENPNVLTLLAELTKSSKNEKVNLRALELIEKALKKQPRSYKAWWVKGLVYSRLKDWEKAEPCFKESLIINPNYNLAYRDLLRARKKARKKRKRVLNWSNFLNPKIRAEKLVKQAGFDPIAFEPLTDDNMVYIHLDGNKDNDDPNTHAWVTKATYEKLKMGTVFKSPKSDIGRQRKLIEKHLETHLGGVDKILDDHRGDKYHIDIYILPPNDKRNYGVMVTSGMSDYGMNMPPKLKFFQHGELYIKLPFDWPYPREQLKQDEYTWIIQNLFLLPRSVHNNRTFFWNGQVIDNDEPFANNTDLSGFLVKYPSTIDIPVEFNMLKVNPQKAICFYQLIPLYNEEMDFLEKHGLEKLHQKFDEYGITDIVDLKRPNVC